MNKNFKERLAISPAVVSQFAARAYTDSKYTSCVRQVPLPNAINTAAFHKIHIRCRQYKMARSDKKKRK
jgi:hypothetical protein